MGIKQVFYSFYTLKYLILNLTITMKNIILPIET